MEIIRDFDKATIEEKLTTAIWMKQRQDPRMAKNPPGYLIRSIEQAFIQPKENTQEKEAKVEAEKARRVVASREAAANKKLKAQEEKEARETEAVKKFWDEMPKEERAEVEKKVLADASPANALLLARGGKVAEVVKQNLLRTFAIEVLAGGY